MAQLDVFTKGGAVHFRESIAYQLTQETLNALPSDLKLDFIEPLVNPRALLDVANLRTAYFTRHAPYMCARDEKEVELERAVDARSVHLALRLGHTLIASIRATKFPFEAQSLLSDLPVDWQKYRDHVEFSRLVINPDIVLSPLILRFLICSAGKLAVDRFNPKGLVAVCREAKFPIYAKFGMRNILPQAFELPSRNGHYLLLAASMETIISRAERIQTTELKIRQKLQKYFGNGLLAKAGGIFP